MKIRVPLVVLALAFVSCAVVTPHSFACSTPPRLTITYSWPANFTVGVNSNNVPSGPVSTAMYNWNTGLSAACYAPILVVGPSTLEINMNYGSIPPPSNCSTCVTRGLTNYTGYANGRISGADVTINSVVTDTAAITEVVAHEFGHTFALVDCNYPGCPVYSSVMESGAPVATPNQTIGASGPTSCDVNAVLSVATDYGCPPPPPPPRCCKCGYPNTSKGKQLYNDFAFRKVLQDGTGADGCEIGWSTTCCGSSPIIIDTTGNGFVLTSAANGVKFDITGKGVLDQVAWTVSRLWQCVSVLARWQRSLQLRQILIRQRYPATAVSDAKRFRGVGRLRPTC